MGRASYEGEIVWIIGASSGIGHALAVELAARGAVLALSARRREALEALRDKLGERHAVHPLDVADHAQLMEAAQAIRAAHGRIDRVVFLSALYTPTRLEALDAASMRQMVEVNVMGAFHAVQAALPILLEQSGGQIALCGSVAAYTGLPGGQPYSATKAAVMNLAESLRAECPERIDVKLISPGFVRTPLTEKNDFTMPAILTPEQAARAIADGLQTHRFEIHFPKRFTLLVKLLRLLPYMVTLKITRNL